MISAWQNKLADAANRCRNAVGSLNASLPIRTNKINGYFAVFTKVSERPAFNRKTRAEPQRQYVFRSGILHTETRKNQNQRNLATNPPPNLPSLPPGIHVTHITEDGLTKTEIDTQSKTSY